MNKVYRIVWNRTLNAPVVVSELTSSAGRASGRFDGGGQRAVRRPGLRTMVAACAFALLFPFASAASAAGAVTIVNGGFETGNFTGWLLGPDSGTQASSAYSSAGVGASVVTGMSNFSDGSYHWNVNPFGNYMASLQATDSQSSSNSFAAAATALGLSSANQSAIAAQLATSGNGAPTNASYMSQTLTLNAGDSFTMAWQYVSTDYTPFNDASITTLINTSSPSELATINNSASQYALLGATNPGTGSYSTDSYGATGWEVATYTVTAAGIYQLGFASFNLSDTVNSPVLFVDQVPGTTFDGTTPVGPVAPNPGSGAPTTGPTATDIVTTSNAAGLQGSSATLLPVLDGGTLILDGTDLTPYSFTITGNNGTVDLNGHSATISNPIADATSGTPGALTVSNSGNGGTLTLSGVNSYTGATSIANGTTLALTGAGSIASSSGVTDNGNFDISGASGNASISTLSGNGAVALGGNSLVLTNASGSFAGTIGGSGGVVLNGGSEVLGGVNTYSGGTTLNGGAFLNISAHASLGNGGLSVGQGSSVAFNNAAQTLGDLSGAGNMALNGTALTTNGDNLSTTYSGVLSGTGSLTKAGNGTLTLSAANTYAGGTTLNGGSQITAIAPVNSILLTTADLVNGANISVGNASATVNASTVSIDAANNLGTGAVAFNGGTLQARASLTAPTAMSVGAGNGAVDNGGNAVDLSGDISGNGGLTFVGAGTTTLSGVNTFSGGAALAGGTVAISSAANLGAGDLSFNGNGTIDNGGHAATFSGKVSGSGSMSYTGTGSTTLSGSNAYAGGSNLLGGTVSIAAPGNLGSGAINFNGGTLLTSSGMTVYAPVTLGSDNGTIDNAGNNDTFTGTINGPGTLTFAGSGATAITGAANSIGHLVVNSDSTLVMGVSGSQLTAISGINAGTLMLASGASLVTSKGLTNTGVLYGTGGTLTGNLNNVSGTVFVAPTPVTSSATGIAPTAVTTVAATPTFANFGQAAVSSFSMVNGDFTQGASGTLNFNVTPTSNTQMQVAGNIQLAGALAVQASAGHYLRTTYTLISDANPNATLTGQFSSIAVSGLPQNWGYNITYVTDPQLLLSVFPLTAFASAGNNSLVVSPIANVAAVGGALDAAVPSSSGTLYQQLNTLYQLPSTQLAAALQQIDGEMYANASGVLSRAVDNSWYPVYSRMGLSATQPGALPGNAPHVWISGLGSVTHIASDDNANGIRQDLGGFLMGVDNNWGRRTAGVTAGSVHAGATRNAAGDSRLSATMWQAGGYASTTFGQSGRAGLLLGYTQGPVDFTNSSVLGTATSKATAQVFSARTRASWTKQLNVGSSLTPVVSLNAETVHLGQVSERGTGPLGLVVPTQDTSTVNARAQLRFDHTWSALGAEWAASSSLGVQQMLVQPDKKLMVNYAGIIGASFAVDGIQTDHTAALFGAGLTARLSDILSAEISYRGTFGTRTTENAVQGKLVLKF